MSAELMLARVSSESLREATGRGWHEWLTLLDDAGAGDWDHKQTVAYLEREHREVSSWWRQSITVGYEQARGKRVVGETADAGFQIGVQRSVAATELQVWEVIASRPDLWLGAGASISLVPGERYEAGEDGSRVSGEVRVVESGERLRLTWQPEAWPKPATLQLTLSTSGSGKTVIGVHLEKLPDAEAREAMRSHWRQVLAGIAAAVRAD